MRGRLIIIEGPDGAGKTTLARTLASDLGLPYYHTGPPSERGALRDYTRFLIDHDEGVVDRFHLGERVYGPIIRKRDTLGEHGHIVVEALARCTHRALIVIALPPLRVVLDTWADRRETELVQERNRMIRIWNAYDRHRAEVLPTVRYDYTVDDCEKVMRYVRKL